MPFATLRTSSAHSRGRLASSAEIPYCDPTSSGKGQADSAAAGFSVSAWLTFVFRRGRLRCSGVICNPQEHGSVIALDCKSSATCDSRADWICKLIITSHLRKDLSHGLLSFRGMVTQLGRAGARRALRGAPRSAHPKAPELIHSGIGTVEPESCRTPSSRYWPVLRHPCRRCINSALRRKTSAHC